MPLNESLTGTCSAPCVATSPDQASVCASSILSASAAAPIDDPWTGSRCTTAVGASTSRATTSTRSQRTAGVMEANVRRQS